MHAQPGHLEFKRRMAFAEAQEMGWEIRLEEILVQEMYVEPIDCIGRLVVS